MTENEELTVVYSSLPADQDKTPKKESNSGGVLSLEDSADVFSSPFPLNHRFSNS